MQKSDTARSETRRQAGGEAGSVGGAPTKLYNSGMKTDEPR